MLVNSRPYIHPKIDVEAQIQKKLRQAERQNDYLKNYEKHKNWKLVNKDGKRLGTAAA